MDKQSRRDVAQDKQPPTVAVGFGGLSPVAPERSGRASAFGGLASSQIFCTAKNNDLSGTIRRKPQRRLPVRESGHRR